MANSCSPNNSNDFEEYLIMVRAGVYGFWLKMSPETAIRATFDKRNIRAELSDMAVHAQEKSASGPERPRYSHRRIQERR